MAKLEQFSENGRRLIRVELDDCPPGHPIYRKISVGLSADDYSPVHAEYLTKTGRSLRSDSVVVNDSREGVPMLMSTRSESRAEDGSRTSASLTVTDRRFGPVPDEEFTLERVLDGASARQVAEEPRQSEVPALVNWYPLPIVMGVVFLVPGASLFPWARRFR